MLTYHEGTLYVLYKVHTYALPPVSLKEHPPEGKLKIE